MGADKDVEMKPANEASEKVSKEQQPAVDPSVAALNDIKHNVSLLDKAVANIESRFTTRVLRTTTSLRRRLNTDVLRNAIRDVYVKDSPNQKNLLSYLPSRSSNDMEVDIDAVPAPSMNAKKEQQQQPLGETLPEVDAYIRLLLLIWLLDQKMCDQGIALANESISKVQSSNRRTLDQLAARLYFFYGRFYELTDRLAEIRPTLLAAQRTASLRHDDETQATLINLLLRNYFQYNLYDQADKLVSKSTFPESAPNPQLARYQYYLGRIKAIQLNYSEAHSNLQQAIRRAPSPTTAPGFQQTVYKFFVIVELLMGDIPDRSIFRQPVLEKALRPYLHIVQAVRVGDLSLFQSTLQTYSSQFLADKTNTLILRLRHNVIKTGIRMISLAYSRISLRDICLKLHLDSEEDAEYIAAKAIRDDVIVAKLDHEKGYMMSKETVDVYATNEPQQQFHQRIQFCLQLHNESVKAMRYPLNAHRKELASAAEARDRERELVKEIAEGDISEGDEDWP